MDEQPSRTALATSYHRAAHLLLDGPPPILDDSVALRLLGAGAESRIRNEEARYQTPGARILRSHVVLRSRVAEDRLAEAVERGVSQYVMLGVGFDTFALRQPPWATALRLFEFDHPATQAEKRLRLTASGLVVPDNTVLVAVDFRAESLLACCQRSGVDLHQPTFFAWLGVTMYLEESEVEATLRAIATFPVGSEVVFTFLQPDPSGPVSAAASASSLGARVARIGEPFRCYLEPDAVTALCRRSGLSSVDILSPQEARRRYFAGRPDDVPAPRRASIAWAVVGDRHSATG
jgi:methyltransferase (TIGR00027 family)